MTGLHTEKNGNIFKYVESAYNYWGLIVFFIPRTSTTHFRRHRAVKRLDTLFTHLGPL